MRDRPVGIFDSGLGGLTVLNSMKTVLPGESYIYVGDTARLPYGEKDAETLLAYGREIIRFLQEKEVKSIIVACGTISSNVMDNLRSEFNMPIFDVVCPGIDAAIALTTSPHSAHTAAISSDGINKKKRVGIIATAATVKSGFFQRKLMEKNPSLEVEAIACPLFVPLIEKGWSEHALAGPIVENYLNIWKVNPIDTLILGCTHFPLLTQNIKRVLNDVVLIDMAVSTTEVVRDYFIENNLLNEDSFVISDKTCLDRNHYTEKNVEFFVSGNLETFNDMGSQITGYNISAQKF